MPEEIEIIMLRDKECKGSVRFVTTDEKAAVTNVYISRAVPGVNAAKSVTIKVIVGQ